MCEWTVPGNRNGYRKHLYYGQTPCQECRDAKNEHERSKHNPVRSRINNNWAKYRLRPDEYQAILDRQNGTCAICDKPFRNLADMHTDHDHKCCPGKKSCGKCVRGILCSGCNRTLVGLENDEWLKRALAYLGGGSHRES